MEVQRLTSLPVEVLSRILMYIDSSDISAVKKTCQTLSCVTMTRQFWYNHIHRLCEEHVVSPPEEELEEYTITELEQWAMRRIRARSTSSVKWQLRSRDGPLVASNDVILFVPGGRWFLKICQNSSVYFVDLDSSNLEEHLLFDPRNIDPCISDCQVVGNSILWIDHKAPRLSFRFQGCLVVDEEGDLPSTWVHIYQVNLTGHGASATLVAQVIATFRSPQNNASLFFSHAFSDHYFVQERSHEFSTFPRLEIFDYRQALERFDYPLLTEYHTHPLEDYPSELEFINEDVLIIYLDTTSSYQIFNVESSTSLQLMHQIKISDIWLYPFRIRWTPKATLFTLIKEKYPDNTKTLHGIVIPHERRFHPWTVELGNITVEVEQGVHLVPGAFNSLTYNGTDKISRIAHEWDYLCESPSISGRTHVSILQQDVDHLSELLDFDEDTGRIIHLGDGKLNVVDIVAAG